MTTQNTLCLSLLATLSLVAGSASAATATEEEAPVPGLPMETDGWVPASDDIYEDVVFKACGTTIILRAGDVQEVEQKVRIKHDGTIVDKYRGDLTVDVIADRDGDGIPPYDGFIDEVDVSGPYSTRFSPDEMTVVETIVGPAIVYPVSPADAAALAGEVSEFFYFEGGKFVIKTSMSGEEGAAESESVEILKNTTRGVVDLCQALKESAVRSG
ncbi:hypothetical protein [Arthrobacter sedimenti]|uniref:hypothetical protein n=1 Tax=Arthrobacter sedimenti TaxID=2694931 RepID=UPI000B357D1F|nr:hypothetical protein [Arthrobacter sedimenti]OUM45323.1 hypothetical protein B8W73_01050 [Arthrobacter agilis]